MKTSLLKPGFEFIFSLSLIAILCLPPVLMAQANKNMDINIVNGDTTVNGRNIKQLSPPEKREALKSISRISSTGSSRSFSDSMRVHIDTANTFAASPYKHKAGPGAQAWNSNRFNDRMGDRGPNNNGRFMMAPFRNERRNSQSFDYVTVDNEGVSTHIRFHVSEISNEDLKKMPHVEGGKFEISDLNLVPQFSTGKTLLLFDLPAKTVAEVKLTDSEGKSLFSEKVTGGTFNKAVVLGLNGVYYLQVKQGNFVAVKKITKGE